LESGVIRDSMKTQITYLLTAFFIILLNSFAGEVAAQERTADDIPVVDYEGLRPWLEKHNDTTYIINFWATWCAPCIKELPYFQEIHNKYIDQKIKVVLVSLDFERQIESRLVPFINKNNITPKVIVLNDPHSNIWIDNISPEWSGGLPATLFYNRFKRLFFEKEFTYDEIEDALNQLVPDENTNVDTNK